MNKKNIIASIVFVVIIFCVFSNVTYLFRNTGYNRDNIIGIKEEKNIDVAYVGGSAGFVYWQPLKAYADKGITSYNYATELIQAENVKGYIEDIRKNCDPKLFVIDARPFQYYSDSPAESGLRNGSDGMNVLSLSRFNMIKDYISNRSIPRDEWVSYYLDIVKYHDNEDNLKNEEAWKNITNKKYNPDKGWVWVDSYAYLDTPSDFVNEKRAVLPANEVALLTDLLEYCKKDNLQVMFVVCPYFITAEDYSKYNTVCDMVESYGYNFVNTNDLYNEIGIDFSTDFYNRNHANPIGAEKYTNYLSEYICSNYELVDHRNDASYADWDAESARFMEELVAHKENISKQIADVQYGTDITTQMKMADNLSELYEIATEQRYTLIMATDGNFEWPERIADKWVLNKMNIKPYEGTKFVIMNAGEIAYEKEDETLDYTGMLGPWEDVEIVAKDTNGQISINVMDQPFVVEPSTISIYVFDNNFRQVVENIVVVSENGRCVLR